mgnify:CR=1 FL=1
MQVPYHLLTMIVLNLFSFNATSSSACFFILNICIHVTVFKFVYFADISLLKIKCVSLKFKVLATKPNESTQQFEAFLKKLEVMIRKAEQLRVVKHVR